MNLEDDIGISDEDDEEVNDEEIDDVPGKADAVDGKVNGQAGEGDREQVDNSASDIEDNDIRETLSDDSDKIQVSKYFFDFFVEEEESNKHESHLM